ncbi:hypothetical protein WJX81_007488 [Elliptochloris bilobata]|uniref:SET domain-containing protein n=1 Tax=Elliptochloris bilobata TaxID=381761 RepID=A0AAW1S721_9CHLO
MERERVLAELRGWLQRQGADVVAIDFAPCQGAGVGVVATEAAMPRMRRGWSAWLWSWAGGGAQDAVLAAFPLSTALTGSTAAALPGGAGAKYAALLELGGCDERTLLMLLLVVERLRGEASPWAPWLAALPACVGSPLTYSDVQLSQLAGTSLHRATRLLRQRLREDWARLEPQCQELLAASGAAEHKPAFADFVWAHSIFWSRAQAFPAPVLHGGRPSVRAEEGIVPGLDFCNHDQASPVRWTIWGGAGNAASEAPVDVRLVARAGAALAPGQQVTFSYGDKGNEELLLLYGFTLEPNPADALMVACPLPPPAEWDALLATRVALLRRRNLAPQLFLPAAALPPQAAYARQRSPQPASGRKNSSSQAMQRRRLSAVQPQLHLAINCQKWSGAACEWRC